VTAYYNEFDSYPAQWLRNLIDAGHIASGVVDDRSIKEVVPDDVREYTQAHFFAGIGLWSHALRLAGWPDDEPVWTGSCPCQPFSAAGKRGGTDDARHLWPDWFKLIRECRPPVVFGEQVASKDGLAWLDLVYADLEGEGYAVAAVDLCAASVGAPHVRQRLFFVAHADGRDARTERLQHVGEWRLHQKNGSHNGTSGIAQQQETETLGNTIGAGLEINQSKSGDARSQQSPIIGAGWADLEWLPCRDGKARPTQPGLFPLAHGYTGRMGRLRAYGNAIVPQVAAEFIRAYLATHLPHQDGPA
jgi:DNA (cytosine-5)-methyltransferase 1